MWDLRGKRQASFQRPNADGVEPTLSPDVQRLLEKVFGKDMHAPPGIPSPDGKHRLVRSSDPDSSAQLLDSSGRPLVTFSGHAATILVLEFSADGQRVLTSSKDGTARLWDLKGRTLKTFNHGMEVYYAVLSPDAQSVVTAGLNDSTPRLWRVRDASYTPLVGHTGPIRSVMFHRNGQPILTASSAGTARLWDLQGKTVAVLEGYHDVRGLGGATFSPDGRRVLTGAQDGARQYLVDAYDLLAIATYRVGRCLTQDEIERYAVPQSPRLLAPWPRCQASVDHD